MARARVLSRTLQSTLKLISWGHTALYLAQPPSLPPPCTPCGEDQLSRKLNGRCSAWLLRFVCSAWKVHKTPEESLQELFEHLPIEVNARQKRKKTTSDYEIHQQPLHQKSRIRKRLFTETPNDNKENIQCWSCCCCFRLFFFPFLFFCNFVLCDKKGIVPLGAPPGGQWSDRPAVSTVRYRPVVSNSPS